MGDLNFDFDSNGLGGIYDVPVHIRKSARNARKCHTIIEGLPDDLDFKKIGKHLAKTNHCSYTIINDDKYGLVIQFSGDKRNEIKKFLIDEEICKPEQLHIHG